LSLVFYCPDQRCNARTLAHEADLDLAVDALVQAENLDYILLGTGDGDFVRLVRALQNRGRRVDISVFNDEFLAFKNRETVLEMDLIRQQDGRYKAERITEYAWDN
jgi:uncharacterized LabA/DUF88 family protein